MFILLGMLAVTASDLPLLLEGRNSEGFRKLRWILYLDWMLTLHTNTDITYALLLRVYLGRRECPV